MFGIDLYEIFRMLVVRYVPVSKKQEAQLSQKGRAMLLVIEYFAKLLKITQGHWKWHHSIVKQ